LIDPSSEITPLDAIGNTTAVPSTQSGKTNHPMGNKRAKEERSQDMN
jgi:hypothetical protein